MQIGKILESSDLRVVLRVFIASLNKWLNKSDIHKYLCMHGHLRRVRVILSLWRTGRDKDGRGVFIEYLSYLLDLYKYKYYLSKYAIYLKILRFKKILMSWEQWYKPVWKAEDLQTSTILRKLFISQTSSKANKVSPIQYTCENS